LTNVLTGLPGGAVVLIDGLIASTVPEVLVPQAQRLRIVVLLHMPVNDEPEGAALSAAAAVVTTSEWSRSRVLEQYPLHPDRVHVAQPGVEAADLAPGTSSGGSLVCVAAVTPDKGHATLLAALADIKDLDWQCVCVGPLAADLDHADHVLRLAREHGIDTRVRFTGPLIGGRLAATYAAADALVLATRAETYGMVVSEALARGLPVLATSVGGVPEALGELPDGSHPGMLVPADEPASLARALRRWLEDGDLRATLRVSARRRRATLSDWSVTAGHVSRVLAEVAA
jgi:glycosyltransferase involved in cell wall biosynthesis